MLQLDRKTKISLIAGAAVLLVAVLAALAVGGIRSSEIEAARADLVAAQQELQLRKDKLSSSAKLDVQTALAVDSDREEKDVALIREMMEVACTWSDYDEYVAARGKMMSEYHLDATSSFLTVFLPDVGTGETPHGGETNVIDARNLSSGLSDVECRLLNVEGASYTYLADVELSGAFQDTAGASHVVVICTVNDNGSVNNLSAYPALD